MRRALPISLFAISCAWLGGACSTSVSLGTGGGAASAGGGGHPSGTGVGGAGGAGTTTVSSTSGTGAGLTTANSSAASTGTGSMPGCVPGGPGEDMDGDGFTPAQGDCNDCDPNINPDAVELPTLPGGVPADENCDGKIDEPQPSCDANLAVDDADPVHAAAAVELCKQSTGPKSWGLVSAKWVLPDGTDPPAASLQSYHLGHGVLPDFGPNVAVQKGSNMLALSSGTARRPTDPGYQDVAGFDKAYSSAPPMGFPKESPACPGVVTGPPHDGVGLEVQVRAPSNAQGFSFRFDFFTYEWPDYICSSYNDAFVALLAPIPMGQQDGDISSDGMGNPMSVNNAFLDACGCGSGPPCMAGGKSFQCPLGDASLVGTGFGKDGMGGVSHGSTSWLASAAPVTPGQVITLRWTVYDSGDGILDTTTLVDDWTWLGVPTTVATYRLVAP